jgi:hypothetical protein
LYVDPINAELKADEKKRNNLIKKIQKRDKWDDVIHLDEPELQALWDAGETGTKKKASAKELFSKGSKVSGVISSNLHARHCC